MIQNVQFETESTKGYAYKLGLFNTLANPLPVYRSGIFGKLELAWDGCPMYYQDCTLFKTRDMSEIVRTLDQKTGQMTMPSRDTIFHGQPLGAYQEARSKGESTLALLGELETALKVVPEVKYTASDSEGVRAWKEYILSRGPSAGYTFLLDEPETHLSISAQREVWNMLIEFSQKHNAQIIAASHSPLVLFLPQIHIVEFKPGYAQESRKTLLEIVEGRR